MAGFSSDSAMRDAVMSSNPVEKTVDEVDNDNATAGCATIPDMCNNKLYLHDSGIPTTITILNSCRLVITWLSRSGSGRVCREFGYDYLTFQKTHPSTPDAHTSSDGNCGILSSRSSHLVVVIVPIATTPHQVTTTKGSPDC